MKRRELEQQGELERQGVRSIEREQVEWTECRSHKSVLWMETQCVQVMSNDGEKL